MTDWIECSWCLGLGRVWHENDPAYPKGHEVTCPICNGRGRLTMAEHERAKQYRDRAGKVEGA